MSCCLFVKTENILKVSFVLAKELNTSVLDLEQLSAREVLDYNDLLKKYMDNQ